MSVIAIIGAGTLGGTLAHLLASHDLYREVRLIDDDGDVAAGKALDILQAGAIERSGTAVVGHDRASATVGADVVVLTGPATAPDTEWDADDGLDRLRRAAAFSRSTLFICAGAGQRSLVERGVSEAGIDRRRLLGSAPEALRAALRAVVALEVGCEASEVALTVLGAPPRHVVVPWSHATVAGLSLAASLAPVRQSRLDERAAALWPPGPYALAAAAGRVAASLATGSGRQTSCFIALDGEFGMRRQALAAPVRLGTRGVSHIVEPRLNPRERSQLEAAGIG
jgi:malate dehydrogenase